MRQQYKSRNRNQALYRTTAKFSQLKAYQKHFFEIKICEIFITYVSIWVRETNFVL